MYVLGVETPSATLLNLLVGNDLLIICMLLLFYISEARAEEEETKYFKSQQLSLDDFSLKLKGFSMTNYEQELEEVIRAIGRRAGEEAVDEIVQIKTPDRVDFIEYQQRKEEAYKGLYEFIYG